jgi:hypothetical protein
MLPDFDNWLDFAGNYWEPPEVVHDTPNQEIVKRGDVVLMQYTGLDDADGKLIFEGDILEGHSDGNVQVVWRGTGWECDFADEGNIGLDEMCLWFGGSRVFVIGNIYEHAHLIEEAKI